MSSTCSIITHIQKSQNSILRKCLVNFAHRYLYVQVCTWYILVCPSWRTCTVSREWASILMFGYYNILVPHTQHPFPQAKVTKLSAQKVSGKHCTDQYIPVRSHPHFISNQALSPLRRSWVSFLRLSDALQTFSFLSKVSTIVRPPRRGLPCHSLDILDMGVLTKQVYYQKKR